MTTTDLARVRPFPAHDPNPLLRIWREVYGDDVYNSTERDMRAYRNAPARDLAERQMSRSEIRTCATCRYAFSVPTDEALDAIAQVGPIVELGAGSGYWAALLRERGVDVLAYDRYPPRDGGNHWYQDREEFHPIVRGTEEVLHWNAHRTLMLSWPPYATPMAAEALRYYERAGGRCLVYVGEGWGGCCADDDFFTRLGEDTFDDVEHSTPWRKVREVLLPQWWGVHDWLTIYERVR